MHWARPLEGRRAIVGGDNLQPTLSRQHDGDVKNTHSRRLFDFMGTQGIQIGHCSTRGVAEIGRISFLRLKKLFFKQN